MGEENFEAGVPLVMRAGGEETGAKQRQKMMESYRWGNGEVRTRWRLWSEVVLAEPAMKKLWS